MYFLATIPTVEAAVNEQSDNLYERYGESPFSALESPPMAFDDAHEHPSEREAAERWGLPYLDDEQLEIDGPSVSRVGPDELVRLAAVPVTSGDGHIHVVVSEPTDARHASVREHFSTDVEIGVVTASTLERLLDVVRIQAVPVDVSIASTVGATFGHVLGLFDEEASRFQSLRLKLQQLGGQMTEREQHLQRLEGELAQARVDRQRDQQTIEQLRQQLGEREGRLEQAAAKAQELRAIIRGSDLQ
jgi:hypothetical protein